MYNDVIRLISLINVYNRFREGSCEQHRMGGIMSGRERERGKDRRERWGRRKGQTSCGPNIVIPHMTNWKKFISHNQCESTNGCRHRSNSCDGSSALSVW